MKTTDIITTDIDRLGMLLAQISDLTAEANKIKNNLKDKATLPNGAKVYEGNLFKAMVVESNRSTVNYEAMVEALKISADVIAKYTKTTAVFSVKTTAR
jgi:hypothetical protein